MTRGEKLKELRNKLGKTQQEVLTDIRKKLGSENSLDKNTLSKAEKGGDISRKTLEILAQYYEVSLDYLNDDSIDNSTSENIRINEILGLSDESIEKIKHINYKTETIGRGRELKHECKTNVMMFNCFIENFDTMYDFLFCMEDIRKDTEMLNVLVDIRAYRGIAEYIIDSYYNDKEKCSQIIESIENKIDTFVNLYKNNINYSHNQDSIEDILELKEIIVKKLKSKKMTEKIKKDIFITLEELVCLSFDFEYEIQKNISFNQYSLTVFMNEFIATFYKKIKKDSCEVELRKMIEECEERIKKYTKAELKKYSVEWKENE